MMLQPKKQYRDYLMRWAESGPSVAAPALTFDEFCAALKLWERQYHAAWTNNDSRKMYLLERMLVLSSTACTANRTGAAKDVLHA